MRIIQIVTTLAFGDAVGNDTLAIKDILKSNGYNTEIFAEVVDERLPDGSAKTIDDIGKIEDDDIIIYHLAIATKLNKWIMKQRGRKIMIYHNITPPHFFREYNPNSFEACKLGLEQAEMLKDTFEMAIADSEFNKQDLIKMGYKCPIVVLPILIAFDDYKKTPNANVIKKYTDDYTNILFVGRIAPNKKQEDVIKAFYYYKKYFNQKSRLIFVGSNGGMERYYNRLVDFIAALGVEDVIFPGHIKFDEILAYYQVSDLFLCMSEHEGFCVPLVEAMYFDVPIMAYNSCAIEWTLGGSGLMFDDKNMLEVAAVMDKVIRNDDLKKQIITEQQNRLADFSHEVVGKDLFKILDQFIAK